ncbi:hypothetical protein [Gluconacetobacter tumulisoli]|uniref:Uncharacterized protein n=1 Tax=Gluconacetobacter tumulisoli TaxID=1286189 RepID=A0A7W4KAC0_9PROT|nr:hypothetical protein [Gluconacetobacter tumulisoli]MBB2203207.1 hypothetical protein [Gluconacetobacter tumulisoli]
MRHFEDIFEDDLDSDRYSGTCSKAPHLRSTIAYIHQKQIVTDAAGKPTREAILRWFQADIITAGSFVVPSPYTGELLRSGASIIMPTREIFFRFPEEPRLLLASSNLGRGYPIVAVILVDLGVFIKMEERIWGIANQHIQHVLAILDTPAWKTPCPTDEVEILTGDSNFAHHAWNQLGALEAACELRGSRRPVPIYVSHQPLGSLDKLIPGFANWPIRWVSTTIPEHLNNPRKVIVAPGGMVVRESIKKRIYDYSLKSTSSRGWVAGRACAHGYPVVWISIRSVNRTAHNQLDFLDSICTSIFSLHRRAVIIIDGTSLPHDLAGNINYAGIGIEENAKRDAGVFNDLMERLQAANSIPTNGRIINACGFDIIDSIFISHHVNFYICHHGTVQHKIGWLTDTPGIIHSNTRTIKTRPGPWVALQAGLESIPEYFPEYLIEDLAIPDTDTSSDPEFFSRLFDAYRFSDLAAATAFVIDRLEKNAPPLSGAALGKHRLRAMARYVSERITAAL